MDAGQWMDCVQGPFIRIHEDGRRTIAYFPEVIVFADDFLEQASPPMVVQGDGIVTLNLSNGSASYGLIGHDLQRKVSVGVKSPTPVGD